MGGASNFSNSAVLIAHAQKEDTFSALFSFPRNSPPLECTMNMVEVLKGRRRKID